MTRKIFILLFSFVFIQNLLAQNAKSEFYPEGSGTLYGREKISSIAFATQNSVDTFFKVLTKRFGSPIDDGNFIIYKSLDKEWADKQIIIRISRSIQIDLDSSQSNIVFIFAETKKRTDLLKPTTSSYRKIMNYFFALYNKLIKNGKADTFD